MKTGILTDPYGNPIGTSSGGVAAPAIDSNHVYVYDCSETSGSTLVNTGAGSNGNLTIYGSENTDYSLNESYIGKSTKAFRNLNNFGVGGAISGTSCSISGGSVTIEIFIAVDYDSGGITGGEAIWADTGVNDWIGMGTYFGTWRTQIVIGGAASVNVYGTSTDLGAPAKHLMSSYDATTGVISFYINGILVNTGSTGGGSNPIATLTRVAVGDASAYTGYCIKGYMTQARVSNIARSASYATSTAETLLSM